MTHTHIVEGVQGLLALLHSVLALLELAECQLELGYMHAQEQQRLLRPRVLRLYQVRDDAIEECHCNATQACMLEQLTGPKQQTCIQRSSSSHSY